MSSWQDRDNFANTVEKVVLEHTTEGHYKYYHLSRKQDDTGFLASWGRIGNAAQTKKYEVSPFVSNIKCNLYVGRAMWEQMNKKLAKGYVIKTHKNFGEHSDGYEEFMAYLKENDTDLDNLLFD